MRPSVARQRELEKATPKCNLSFFVFVSFRGSRWQINQLAPPNH